MRTLQLVGLLVLGGVLAYVTAEFADPSPAGGPIGEVRAIKQRAPEDWLAACLVDWDPQTHMTKIQWRNSCERVAGERGYFHIDALFEADRTGEPQAAIAVFFDQKNQRQAKHEHGDVKAGGQVTCQRWRRKFLCLSLKAS